MLMRLQSPRIAPVDMERLDADQRAALEGLAGPRGVLNIFRTLAHAPKALTRFLEWGGYVLSRRNSLSPRDREILILRIGYLCRSGYEFTQHTRIALEEGLTREDIARVKAGAAADGWSGAEATLIRAADELHADQFISEATWQALGVHFDQKQCMDVVFTVGQYTQVSMMLNTFGVQLEGGANPDPDLKAW
jgi:alkylhydroperoxidase family enzyme